MKLLFAVLLIFHLCFSTSLTTQSSLIQIFESEGYLNIDNSFNYGITIIQQGFQITNHPSETFILFETNNIENISEVLLCINSFSAIAYDLGNNCIKDLLIVSNNNENNENIKKQTINTSLFLKQNIQYFLSLNFVQKENTSIDSLPNYNIKINSNNVTCLSNQIPTAIDCIDLDFSLTTNNSNFTLQNMSNGQLRYFSIIIPALVPKATLKVSLIPITNITQIEIENNSNLKIILSYNDFPNSNNYQYKFTGSLDETKPSKQFSIDTPIQGIYYGRILSYIDYDLQISYEYEECLITETENNTCSINYNILNNLTINEINEEMKYFLVTNISNLQIGAQFTDNHYDENHVIVMAIGYNYFPSLLVVPINEIIGDSSSSLIGGNEIINIIDNENSGSSVFTILNNPLNETTNYIIGIIVLNVDNSSIAIWKDSLCPLNCNNHGSCEDFRCSCSKGKSGDYCNENRIEISDVYVVLFVTCNIVVLICLIMILYRFLCYRRNKEYQRLI